MAIFKNKHKDNFTQIDNSFSRRTDLSALAKILMINILSHPCDWKFTPESLTKECKEGITAVRRALNELIKTGHVERIRKRTSSGQFAYEFNAYETPQSEKNISSTSELEEKKPPVKKDFVQRPYSDLPIMENPQAVNDSPILIYNKKRVTKKELQRESEKTAHAQTQAFGKFKNISLTSEEYETLVKTYGKKQTDMSIESMSEYMEIHNKNYPKQYARLDLWIRQDIDKANHTESSYQKESKRKSKNNFDVSAYACCINNF